MFLPDRFWVEQNGHAQLNMDTGSKHNLYCLHICYGITVDLLINLL